MTPAMMRAAFDKADADSSGVLSETEVKAALSGMSLRRDTDSGLLFTALDRDGDGKVSYEEFANFVTAREQELLAM